MPCKRNMQLTVFVISHTCIEYTFALKLLERKRTWLNGCVFVFELRGCGLESYITVTYTGL